MNMLKLFGKDINVPPSRNTKREQKITGPVKKRNVFKRFLPFGHGKYKGYFEAFAAFRKKSWRTLFEKYGFTIKEIHPLLLYGPSEWPLVPTTTLFNKCGLTSSILFIMKTT